MEHQNHQHNHHDHQHHHHNHEDFDPGELYKTEWVQGLISMIRTWLQENTQWLDIQPDKSQRILDYACGNGLVSRAFGESCQLSTFQGIDSHPKQAQRFDDEARALLGDSHDRMFAVHGDLLDPSPELEDPKWFDFDVVIISMALHHVEDPLNMLTRLNGRMKRGGTLIVVEWIPEQGFVDQGSNQDDHSHGVDESKMIEVHEGRQKIWPGFSQEKLEGLVSAAGCSSVEGKRHTQTFKIPDHMGNAGEKRLIMAKGIVN